MGSLYYVRKARNFLNKSLFKIYRNKYGNFVNAEHKISSIVRKKFQNLKLANDNDEITIKLCGDGMVHKQEKKIQYLIFASLCHKKAKWQKHQ